MDTITHYINNQISHFKGFNRFSNFILIGNRIDGFLNFDKEKFNSFSEVQEWLPIIIDQLEEGGEWALELYQVPADFKIKRQYGYYEVPSKGKKVFKFNYMNSGKKIRTFVGNAVIHFCSQTIYKDVDNNSNPPIISYRVFEDNYTIYLHEFEERRTFELANYPGNLEQIEQNRVNQKWERLAPAPAIKIDRA
jgi:hypothetical protein